MVEKIFRKGETERLEKALGLASPSRKGMLLYHGDADGVTSAALFLRFFRGFIYSPRKGPSIGEDLERVILEKSPKLLVFLDLPVDQEREALKRLLKALPDLKIAILDHHIPEKDITSKRIIHINPRFIRKDAYIPGACMVYRFLEEIGKPVRPLIWIAAIGVIGDYGWPDCPGLMEEARKEYPYLLKGEPRKSRLGHGADMIAAASTLKGLYGVGASLKALLPAECLEDFEGYKELKEWKGEYDREFESVMEEFRKEKQEGDLITFEVKSSLSITSQLSTHIGEKYPDKTVAIRKAFGEKWKVSLRNQEGRVNLGRIVKKAVKGIGSGGGHEKAAAALVDDWEKFLKRLRKELRVSS